MPTVDLTDDQLRYLRRLIASDVASCGSAVKSPQFENYGPTERERVFADIRTGAQLIGLLPTPPRKDFVEVPVYRRRSA
jgi:hypothetical protein